jgi:hypothetical protein
MDPAVIEAENLKAAFDQYPGCESRLGTMGLHHSLVSESIRYFWEGDDDSLQSGMSMSYPRRDRLLSRRRWQFATRDERQASHVREFESAPDMES